MARAKESEWAKRVERWRDSGLTAKEFAAETGLNASTLSYWKWRLTSESEAARGRSAGGSDGRKSALRRSSKQRRPTKRAANASGFVEVSVSTEPSASGVLEVVMATGTRVRVPSGADEQTLSTVLRALEAAR